MIPIHGVVHVVLGRRGEDPVVHGQGLKGQVRMIQLAIPDAEGRGDGEHGIAGAHEGQNHRRAEGQG